MKGEFGGTSPRTRCGESLRIPLIVRERPIHLNAYKLAVP